MRTFVAKKIKNQDGKVVWWKAFLMLIFFGFLTGVVAVVGVFAYFAKDLPDPNKVNKRVVAESTKIYDRTGQHVLYEIHGEEKRTLIPFEEMPQSIRYATIASEDQDFYSHYGIKFSSIARAVIKDILNRGASQGGSTITQQFVKNSILTSEKTITRKIKEVILSLEIEQRFSKDEILRMYLNEIPYGSNAYGIESAAQTFFGKHAKELDYDEAAVLAVLPRATTFFSPFGSHTDRLKVNQEAVLDKMANLGYISKEDAKKYKETDVLNKITVKRENINAPHFVMYVKEYLDNKYGAREMEEGGMKIFTTLDWDKQQIAEKAVREGAESNKEKWNAENAALVAIDSKNGQILAMVGSKDYFDKTIDGQVNVAIRDRQPGSSFKPYVYLTAFAKGYFPDTIVYDVETDFNKGSDDNYIPQNYDGSFRGPLKMKEALGMSLNVPAVKALYLAGVKDSIEMAKNLGVGGLNEPDRYGLSLVLGGGEVQLLDHTNAYATLSNNGVRHNKTAILRIEDKNGKVIEEFKDTSGDRVVKEEYIAMLNSVISNNKYRAPVFGENNPLKFDDGLVSAKTGTTNEFRDGWTMGYTSSIAVGVWAGNNDNSPMKTGADGVNVAAPIWRSFLDQISGNSNKEKFPEYNADEVLKDIKKDILTGKLDTEKKIEVCEIPGKDDKWCKANKYCPDDQKKTKNIIEAHSILWYVNREDPQGEYPEKPEKDSQFLRWEEGVKKWYKKNKDKKYISDEDVEGDCDEEDFDKYSPKLTLNTDKESNKIKISVSVSASYGIDNVKVYADGDEINSSDSGSFNLTYDVPNSKNNSNIKIEAKVRDKNGNEASSEENVSMSF
ncbi:MAG: Penicillin-binding protein, 1A family [Candidatus Moranbacteria bacterium GW2011_GWF2_34_56]|nr:MAG: Penicillin-binding protein, 1A family [Candidatus Moranbacteria bacterium GW2011_GWF1_34_10]KKP64854.1 MAG: Penicillin-binding protein, 1A family [Candidatus Moranbacteria bacterium GW2011_GWF2_34_56]HBI17702.1 penicillin-binding protein [Candidatus Moranbacteria bacterium]